ncbi:MAG: hypothetical protein WD360_01245 [Nitriliruptoraceae bacterium]
MVLRVLGVVLLFGGATAATVLHRRYARALPVQLVVVLLALSGAVMGAGAALVRDFAWLPTVIFAAVVVPVVALFAAARAARKRPH